MARPGASNTKGLLRKVFRMSLLCSMASRWSATASRFPPSLAFLSASSRPRHQLSSSSFLFRRHSFLGMNTGSTQQQPGGDFEPTWTYVPYDPTKQKQHPPRPKRRPFSTWNVPNSVTIPEDQLEISFTRSSGAGGQNVNKVNTKVEIKLQVMEATFMPMEVRERLSKNQSNRINKDGYLIITSQEYRTQAQNRKAAVAKLQEMVLEAWPRPKIRKQRKGISKAAKKRNKEFKQRRSEKKASRGRVDF